MCQVLINSLFRGSIQCNQMENALLSSSRELCTSLQNILCLKQIFLKITTEEMLRTGLAELLEGSMFEGVGGIQLIFYIKAT